VKTRWGLRVPSFPNGPNVRIYMLMIKSPNFIQYRSTKTPPTLRRRNLRTEVSHWKRSKCFPSTLLRRNLKTQQLPLIWICVWGNLGQRNHMIIVIVIVIVFEKLRFQNVFRLHESEQHLKSLLKSKHCTLTRGESLVTHLTEGSRVCRRRSNQSGAWVKSADIAEQQACLQLHNPD